MKAERAAALHLYLAVGFGAAIGSLFRFLSSFVAVTILGLSPLAGTAFVNIVGSFIIMGFATLTGPDGRLLLRPAARQFVMAGFCGGFTTFSTMSLETFMLLINGDGPWAMLYLALVVGCSLAAAWLGHMLAARINR